MESWVLPKAILKAVLFFGLASTFAKALGKVVSRPDQVQNLLHSLAALEKKREDSWKSLENQIFMTLRSSIKGWENCSQYQSTLLSGAMTNTVFKFWKNDGTHGENSCVLVRCYGASTELFFQRSFEIEALKKMGELGLGPKLLALHDWGRVEEFINAMTLTAPLLKRKDIIELIAVQMYRLHQLKLFDNLLHHSSDQMSIHQIHGPSLFRTLRDWHLKALNICGKNYKGWNIESIGEFINVYENFIQSKQINFPIVFSHNDLQYGNILYKQDENRVILIDLEYSEYNYRGFDIANHWCEWAADYNSPTPHKLNFSLMPTTEIKMFFCRKYLENSELSGLNDYDFNEATKQLVNEVELFIPASHLFWGIWGLLQDKVSSIQFDFFDYASQRLEAHIEWMEKEQMIN